MATSKKTPPNTEAGAGEGRPPLILLGTNTCAGNLFSLLNSLDPGYREIITGLFECRFNYLLMAAEGKMALEVLEETKRNFWGKYFLVVEGSVSTAAGGLYNVIGIKNGRPLTALEAVRDLGPGARHVVALGSCAAFGGPYAAAPNPSGSVSVQAVLDRRVINVPGCPVNPEWIVGTLVHLLYYGEPELDGFNRPVLFYGETIHNLCQRRHYFDQGIFAEKPGEPWCMYKIGCKGPVTHADCPVRQWSGEHTSWPVKANTPCIGCTSPEFPEEDMPFFEHLPDVRLPGIRVAADRVGAAAGAATALGIGAHLAASILTGRLPHTFKKGFSGKGTAGALAGALKKLRRKK